MSSVTALMFLGGEQPREGVWPCEGGLSQELRSCIFLSVSLLNSRNQFSMFRVRIREAAGLFTITVSQPGETRMYHENSLPNGKTTRKKLKIN